MNELGTRVEWNGMMTVLERIETKIDAHERYFVSIGATFGAIHERFDAMDPRFDRLEETVRHQGVLHERLESKVDAVIEVLGTKASKTELHEEVSRLESKIDGLDAKLDAKVDVLDAKIDTVIEILRKQ